MKKLFTLIFFLLCVQYLSFSQYADIGTGALKNDIWWFNWAGMNLSANPSQTVTTPDGLTITYSLIGFPPNYPTANIMNTWSGAVLHLLYDFSDPAIRPALFQRLPAGSNLQFSVNVKVSRNGVPVPFTLVAADAEASNLNEITTLTSDGSPWQIVDFFRNSSQTSNPVSGCNTNTVVLADTYGNAPATGQNPVMASSTSTGDITINTNLEYRALGSMAVAFGIMAPVDRGDLPASYGYAYHGLTYSITNGCNYLPPLPSATTSQTLYLGSVAGDADGMQTADDNAAGIDEDAFGSPAVYPAYTSLGTYNITVMLNNTTGRDAYLTGWFDYNRNGVFETAESATVTVPNAATTAILTWTGLPTYLPQGAASDYAMRLRFSSDLSATQNAAGFARDGEVEDHMIPAEELCNIHLQTFGDTTVCVNKPVTLTTISGHATNFSWDQTTYLNDASVASPVCTPAADITYTVTGSNPQGCESKDRITVSVFTPNFVVNPVNSPVCENAPLQLTASGGDDYTWLDGSNTQVGTTASISLSATTSQTYQVLIKENKCNYTDTRSIPVTVNSAPIPAISKSNDVGCNTGQATLHASGGSTYVWDVTPGISDLTSADPVVTPMQTTTYFVKVSDNTGCTARGSVTVTVDNQQPVVTVNDDTAICNGTALQLSANAPGAVSYAWLPQTGLNNSAIPTPVAQPAIATTYVVMATGSNGCIGKDSVKVSFYGPPAFIVSPANATLCEKDSVLLAALGGIDYTWLAPDNSVLGTTAAIMTHPAATQTYRVIIKDKCNNSDTRSIPVTVHTRPIAEVTKSNDVDCAAPQATLRATGGVDYVWNAAPGLDNKTSANPKVTPAQTTTYIVTVTNSRGCSTRDSITVLADFAKGMSAYPVPSAFTPNNDGRNDCFGLKQWGQVTQLQFQVFNRWGQRVFSSTDPALCWDGTFKGKPLSAGGYAYTIKAVTSCGTVNRSGMVMLIR